MIPVSHSLSTKVRESSVHNEGPRLRLYMVSKRAIEQFQRPASHSLSASDSMMQEKSTFRKLLSEPSLTKSAQEIGTSIITSCRENARHQRRDVRHRSTDQRPKRQNRLDFGIHDYYPIEKHSLSRSLLPPTPRSAMTQFMALCSLFFMGVFD